MWASARIRAPAAMTRTPPLLELDYPVTTDLEKIREGLQAERPEALTAVFCTYQSLPLVETAQAEGAPAFDLVVCDEAHRTTGVEESVSKGKDEQKVSPFRLVHDKDSIHAHKRLYATATPRLYTESARGRAADRNLDIYSMDDGIGLRPRVLQNGLFPSHRGRLADRLQGDHPDAEGGPGIRRPGQPIGHGTGVGPESG